MLSGPCLAKPQNRRCRPHCGTEFASFEGVPARHPGDIDFSTDALYAKVKPTRQLEYMTYKLQKTTYK